MLDYAIAALGSFFVTVLAIVALRPVAIAVDLIDRPGCRKTHHGEVPVVGGLAMFMGVVLGIGLLPLPHATGAAFLAGCTVLVTVGLLDDRFDLSPWTRLAVQAIAVTMLMLGSSSVVTTLGRPFGETEITLSGYGSYVFTILITVAAMNAFNMLDGMDGLAGAIAVVALSALAYLSGAQGLLVTTSLTLVVAGAVVAFLFFNVPASRKRSRHCFMGDAGSTLLGFAVAWLCIRASQSPQRDIAPVTVLWVVALPLYELCWTTLRRILRGTSPFQADRKHFHHLLLKGGFTVQTAFSVYVTLASMLAAFGLVSHGIGLPESTSLALLVVAGMGTVRLMHRADLLLRLLSKVFQRVAVPATVRQSIPEGITPGT